MPTQNRYIKYFKVLGLPKTATEEDITQAHRNLARSYHPDKVSKDEVQEANGYMSQLTEARDRLLIDYIPMSKSLKRRRLSQEEQGPRQSPSSPAESNTAEQPARKKHRQSPDATPPQGVSITSSTPPTEHNGNTVIQYNPQSTFVPPMNIDVAYIRSEFADLFKSRLIAWLKQTFPLTPSEINNQEKASKAENVIFATHLRVQSLLLDHMNQNISPTSCAPKITQGELDAQVDHLCQPKLTRKWAMNSKEACEMELVNKYGYDPVQLKKWKHWDFVNELVKRETPASCSSAEPPTKLGHPLAQPEFRSTNSLTLTDDQKRDMIVRFSGETNLRLDWAEKCMVHHKFKYELAKGAYEELAARNQIDQGCYIEGSPAAMKLLGWNGLG